MTTTSTASTTSTDSTTLTPRRLATAIGNEVGKGLRQGWSERIQILIEMPLFVIFILLMGFLVGKGRLIASGGRLDWTLDPYRMAWLLLAMVAFTMAYLSVQKMFWRLLGEIQTGTLEQAYLSPLPSWLHVAAGRAVAALAETALVVAVLYGATSLTVDIDLHWHAAALLPLALLLIGSTGLALLVAALTLVWKRTEMLNDLLLVAVMFLSGAFLPLTQLPGWARALAKPLYLTHDIAALRAIMLDGHTPGLWGTGGLAWLTATAAGWLIGGAAAFTACEHIAKRRGTLTRY